MGTRNAPAVAGALAATSVLVVLFLAVGVLGGGSSSSSAVVLDKGVPVGVRDTPAGALAAADNYVALLSRSVEQSPAVFAAGVAQDYAPGARALALSQGQQLRAGDVRNMRNYRAGGHGIALIAARRLDSYTPASAVVTSWLGGIVWGPRLAPAQTWNLVDTRLVWHAGRWLIESCETEKTPAPVPSVVYVDGSNDDTAAFARLAGMSSPYYGAAE